jgi:2-dehydro-3-deoxyphosphooctonate aldolase (KDO 8-P synthase)
LQFKILTMNLQHIPQIKYTDGGNFFLLSCFAPLKGKWHVQLWKLVGITDNLQIPFVFKGSFKKANRSRIDSFSGIGSEKTKI